MQRRGAGRGPGKVQSTRKPKATRKTSVVRSAIANPEEDLVERLRRERDEAVELQSASAGVLRIIGSSPGDLNPVFEAMLGSALRICDTKFGHILLYD
jgi:two-component system, NtrC family, sensor kinase